MILMPCLQPLSRAGTLLVSYSLDPQAPGTIFDTELSAVTSVTAANNTAY